jgi:hypothetical protein
MRSSSSSSSLLVILLVLILLRVSRSYTHAPCTRAARAQFQFPDCYLPRMNEDQMLSEASFLLSHNAATGYIQRNSLSKTGLSWWYSKNQVGSVYQQLQDGARALDLRPLLLRNGTVIFQHGAIHIPVSLQQVVADAVQWCKENPNELVVTLPSHFAYESLSSTTTATKYSSQTNDDHDYIDESSGVDDTVTAAGTTMDMVSAIATVLEEFGVPYYDCSAVYGLTVAQTLELAQLSSPVSNNDGSSGHLLVLDGHDVSGTSCSKENWVERQLVTCYPNTTLQCTVSDVPWQALQQYVLASANNEATDDRSTLGPPATLYDTPFNQIQALWQVTTASAVIGMSRVSSILQDNQRSRVNERVMDMVHGGEFFRAISLLAVDNVAWNGNALTSVLRNQCGQSILVGEQVCGDALSKPALTYTHLSAKQLVGIGVALYIAWFVYSVVYLKRPKLFYTAVSRLIMSFNTTTNKATLLDALDSTDESRRAELLAG